MKRKLDKNQINKEEYLSILLYFWGGKGDIERYTFLIVNI